MCFIRLRPFDRYKLVVAPNLHILGITYIGGWFTIYLMDQIVIWLVQVCNGQSHIRDVPLEVDAGGHMGEVWNVINHIAKPHMIRLPQGRAAILMGKEYDKVVQLASGEVLLLR